MHSSKLWDCLIHEFLALNLLPHFQAMTSNRWQAASKRLLVAPTSASKGMANVIAGDHASLLENHLCRSEVHTAGFLVIDQGRQFLPLSQGRIFVAGVDNA